MGVNSQNALAYTRLQPLKNTDTGSLVENHIRFWKKYDDDAEAKKKLLDLKQAEYNRKLMADSAKGLPKIKDAGKVALYLGDTWLQVYRNNLLPSYLDAQKRAKLGDESAKLKLYQINNTIDEMNRTNDVWTEKSKYFANKENMKRYNPLYDKDDFELFKALSNAQFTHNKQGKIEVFYSGKKHEYTIPELNQRIASIKFTGNWAANAYAKLGKSLSERVKVKDINGNIIAAKNDRVKLNALVDDQFNDEVFAKTYAYKLKTQGIRGFEDVSVDKSLTPSQKSLAKSLWKEKYMGIQEKSNSIANAKSLESIRKSKHDRKQNVITINPSTTDKGELLQQRKDYKNDNIIAIYHLSSQDKNGKNSTTKLPDGTELTSVALTKDGHLIGLGYKDVTPKDKYGKKIGDKKTVLNTVTDEVLLNNVATRISRTGYADDKFKNANELNEYMINNARDILAKQKAYNKSWGK